MSTIWEKCQINQLKMTLALKCNARHDYMLIFNYRTCTGTILKLISHYMKTKSCYGKFSTNTCTYKYSHNTQFSRMITDRATTDKAKTWLKQSIKPTDIISMPVRVLVNIVITILYICRK